jgi:hypothetical protein
MIAEPSPFRQTREERLAESRRNAAEARARALNEARVSAARRKEKEKENVFRGGAVSTSKSAYASAGGGGGSGGGRFRSSRAGGASVKKHGKGDASRPTLGFTAARKRGGLYRGLSDDEDEDDEETRSGSEDDGTRARARRRAGTRPPVSPVATTAAVFRSGPSRAPARRPRGRSLSRLSVTVATESRRSLCLARSST